MSLFSRLFSSNRPGLRRFPDSFTMTNLRKQETLCQWVREQSQKQTVVVLTHFQSSFLQAQTTLQDAEIDFEILTDQVDSNQFGQKIPEHKTWLTMSQMLQPFPDEVAESTSHPTQRESPERLAVIVTERYPLLERDRTLETFLSQLPMKVALGYLISFEDPILRHLLGQKFIDLMKQLGVSDNDLISSVMTNRGLARKLKSATSSVKDERFAESPQEWIELNLPND